VKPKINLRSAQLESVQALDAAGLGISLVFAMSARSRRVNLPEYRPLVPPKPQRKIIAARPRRRISQAGFRAFRQIPPLISFGRLKIKRTKVETQSA